jgi:hypothetical protein
VVLLTTCIYCISTQRWILQQLSVLYLYQASNIMSQLSQISVQKRRLTVRLHHLHSPLHETCQSGMADQMEACGCTLL